MAYTFSTKFKIPRKSNLSHLRARKRMLRRLLHSHIIRRIPATCTVTNKLTKSHSSFPLITKLDLAKLLLTTKTVLLVKHNSNEDMENFDLNLQQACDLGESAIVELMDLLREQILQVCKAYKDCLKKQVEIINEASEIGTLASRWDDLPKYRTLALELNQELANMTVVLNTIGRMVHEESLRYITSQKDHLKVIDVKFKELEDVLKTQMKEIKKFEAALLDANKKSILKAS